MSPEDYAQAPASVTVRELRAGGKTLVTTLLCPKQTSKYAVKRLYRDRWHIELDLRNIKTTLGMEQLGCQTPAMEVKEIWVYLLAYNLIRLMMAQAALLNGCLPRQLSFKHTVQVWLAWAPHAYHSDIAHPNELFVLIAQQTVGNRQGRIEPRAIKRRQNAYPLLTQPRSVAREGAHKMAIPKRLGKCHSGLSPVLPGSSPRYLRAEPDYPGGSTRRCRYSRAALRCPACRGRQCGGLRSWNS